VILHHRVAGSGSAVLFLHAGVCDGSMWDRQLTDLSTDHLVIAPDMRGYGATPLSDEAYSDAEDVLQLLDHLDIQEFALVGASYGGRVALEVASHPEARVSKLMLLCAAAEGLEPTPSVEAFAAQEDLFLGAGDIEQATELNVATWLGPEADESARELVRTMQRHAFEVQLAAGDVVTLHADVDLSRLDVPALVVTGEHDLDFFQQVGRHLEEGLPVASLRELPWAGHLPTLERPAEMSELIRNWLTAD
jgi:3-oxoadipate enol-lactonase